MANFYTDQAAGLRRLMGNNSVQVITLAAGCRGIGRSTLLANFAVRLSRLGRNVLIINTNNNDNNNNNNNDELLNYFGHNNKNNNVIAKNNLANLVENKDKTSENIIIPAATNVYILSANKLNNLFNYDVSKYNKFIESLNNFNPSIDTILIDGYIQNTNFLPFILASQETILLVSTTADSVSKIYHLAKQVSQVNQSKNLCFHLLVNQIKSPNEAHFIFDKLAQVIQSRNIATLQYLGYLPFDDGIKYSAKLDEPYIIQFPNSLFSQSINHLANTLQAWQHQQENNNLNIISNNIITNISNNISNKTNDKNINKDDNKYFANIVDFFKYLQSININIKINK